MTRDITKEEQSAIKTAAWKEGYSRAMEICQAEKDARDIDSMQRGIRIGRNEILKEIDGVQWARLFGIVIVGSVIGCGVILALAVGLTNLPPHV